MSNVSRREVTSQMEFGLKAAKTYKSKNIKTAKLKHKCKDEN